MGKITITIDNSYSRIEGLTTEQHRSLKKLLSYTDNPEAAYFGRGFVRTKTLLDKKGNFPSGLFWKVDTWCNSTGTRAEWVDKRIYPIPKGKIFKFKIPINPYEWQKTAVDAAMTSTPMGGGIVAPTGTGKSLVIALLTHRLQAKTLVVVPTLEIKKQLKASLIEYFGENDNIVVENIDSGALETLTDFDCLIIDECHHVAAKTYQKLNKKAWNKIHYRFFLTATWGRNKTNENLLFEGIAGEVIYKLTYKEAVKKGYIVPIEAYYIDLPKQETDAYTWAQVYKELVTSNNHRNEAISDLLLNLNTAGISTLCLVKEIKHGNNIQEKCLMGFVNGQDESTRALIQQFNNNVSKVLIATTGIMGEGVDSKPCEYVIIAGLGKAKSAFMQQIGRAVRTYPGKESAKIILFRDRSHKFCLRHFNEQCKILKEEYGVIPTKLEI